MLFLRSKPELKLPVNIIRLIIRRHIVAPDTVDLHLCRLPYILKLNIDRLLLLICCVDDTSPSFQALRELLARFFIYFHYFFFGHTVRIQVNQHVF